MSISYPGSEGVNEKGSQGIKFS